VPHIVLSVSKDLLAIAIRRRRCSKCPRKQKKLETGTVARSFPMSLEIVALL
jgi:hypothetical protein